MFEVNNDAYVLTIYNPILLSHKMSLDQTSSLHLGYKPGILKILKETQQTISTILKKIGE